MSGNPANQPIEDQFLRWRQEMEVKQEEQARQMAELRDQENHLQQENDRLRTRLETNRGPTQPAPLVHLNKGKEPVIPDESDPQANDKLSYGSSPLPNRSPP